MWELLTLHVEFTYFAVFLNLYEIICSAKLAWFDELVQVKKKCLLAYKYRDAQSNQV